MVGIGAFGVEGIHAGVVEVATLSPPENAPTLETLAELPRQTPALVSATDGQVMAASITATGITKNTITSADAARQFAWRQGMLAFSGDSLTSVIADVSRYTDIKIDIADPALNDLKVSGYFKVGEVEPMLDALAAGFGVHVERLDPRHVRLTSDS